MHYVTFRHGADVRPGVTSEDGIRPFPHSIATMLDFIGLDPVERANVLLANVLLVPPIPFHLSTPLAPIRPRKNIFAVGLNYLGHAEEIARSRGAEVRLPKVPTFFTKAPTSVADPVSTLHLSSAVSLEWDWEAELAIVIGQRCKDVPIADALSVVFGYTALNDVTARDLQRDHKQWFKGKSLDDCCPLGPAIVGVDEIPDPGNLAIEMRVNGVVKQHASTSQMIFNVPAIIASLSRGMTLEAGDVIATGTPDGVGFARTPPEFLKDGDEMEVDIGGIGVLRNFVSIK
jgi:2-keto-4-pentenoate hydratase/2-oxohepta-3-ene-1,7-dioic acid hydratase in catechol pathway